METQKNRDQFHREIITASVCCQTGALSSPAVDPVNATFFLPCSPISIVRKIMMWRRYTTIRVVLFSRRRRPCARPLLDSLSCSVKPLDCSSCLYYLDGFVSFGLFSRSSMPLSMLLLLLSIRLLRLMTEEPCLPCCCGCCDCPPC